ncbi:hypothetical protein C8R46DRAFT_450392 [Mycena filopes]|nr:hypothetical protein C8R46DRAFT_450392 [Mycena filopes]
MEWRQCRMDPDTQTYAASIASKLIRDGLIKPSRRTRVVEEIGAVELLQFGASALISIPDSTDTEYGAVFFWVPRPIWRLVLLAERGAKEWGTEKEQSDREDDEVVARFVVLLQVRAVVAARMNWPSPPDAGAIQRIALFFGSIVKRQNPIRSRYLAELNRKCLPALIERHLEQFPLPPYPWHENMAKRGTRYLTSPWAVASITPQHREAFEKRMKRKLWCATELEQMEHPLVLRAEQRLAEDAQFARLISTHAQLCSSNPHGTAAYWFPIVAAFILRLWELERAGEQAALLLVLQQWPREVEECLSADSDYNAMFLEDPPGVLKRHWESVGGDLQSLDTVLQVDQVPALWFSRDDCVRRILRIMDLEAFVDCSLPFVFVPATIQRHAFRSFALDCFAERYTAERASGQTFSAWLVAAIYEPGFWSSVSIGHHQICRRWLRTLITAGALPESLALTESQAAQHWDFEYPTEGGWERERDGPLSLQQIATKIGVLFRQQAPLYLDQMRALLVACPSLAHFPEFDLARHPDILIPLSRQESHQDLVFRENFGIVARLFDDTFLLDPPLEWRCLGAIYGDRLGFVTYENLVRRLRSVALEGLASEVFNRVCATYSDWRVDGDLALLDLFLQWLARRTGDDVICAPTWTEGDVIGVIATWLGDHFRNPFNANGEQGERTKLRPPKTSKDPNTIGTALLDSLDRMWRWLATSGALNLTTSARQMLRDAAMKMLLSKNLTNHNLQKLDLLILSIVLGRMPRAATLLDPRVETLSLQSPSTSHHPVQIKLPNLIGLFVWVTKGTMKLPEQGRLQQLVTSPDEKLEDGGNSVRRLIRHYVQCEVLRHGSGQGRQGGKRKSHKLYKKSDLPLECPCTVLLQAIMECVRQLLTRFISPELPRQAFPTLPPALTVMVAGWHTAVDALSFPSSPPPLFHEPLPSIGTQPTSLDAIDIERGMHCALQRIRRHLEAPPADLAGEDRWRGACRLISGSLIKPGPAGGAVSLLQLEMLEEILYSSGDIPSESLEN